MPDTWVTVDLKFRSARLVVTLAQIVLHEGDEPEALADAGDFDATASEGCA
jgi:hypothetical protein